MLRTLVPSLLTATVLAGCYAGPADPSAADDTTGAGTTTSAGETADATTGGSLTTGPTTVPVTATTDVTTTTDVTGDITGGATTGGIDATTGGDDTTTAPATTTDPSTTTTATTDPTGMPGEPDVPDNAYCGPVADVDPAWRQLEQDVLVLVNQNRAMGADCGSKGVFGPAPPLTMDPALRCAARNHSADMNTRAFFDHTNPDGLLPWDRMELAGYGAYTNAGENIAAGSPDAAGTMTQWMDSDGHCGNIMNPEFENIGVGYHPGGQYGHLWTQVFGAK